MNAPKKRRGRPRSPRPARVTISPRISPINRVALDALAASFKVGPAELARAILEEALERPCLRPEVVARLPRP